ncbi:hypothetical protein lerEdw1_006358 [Lerista edwardsae]|nr:hypothetical protein lerEdw1_006358 [Lerista edwardsae]
MIWAGRDGDRECVGRRCEHAPADGTGRDMTGTARKRGHLSPPPPWQHHKGSPPRGFESAAASSPSPAMSSPRGSCPEVGTLATQILGGMVLLCVAANAVSLLCLRPQRLRSSAAHEARKGAGNSRRAERAKSTCRCASAPWGSAWRRAHKGTGRGDEGSGSLQQLRLEARAGAGAAQDKASEHSSSWLGGAPTVKEQRGGRQVSRQTRLPAARPARPLALPQEDDSDSTVGQVVYDARWMHCVVGRPPQGRSSTAAALGQRASRPGGGGGPLKAAGCQSWLGPPQ